VVLQKGGVLSDADLPLQGLVGVIAIFGLAWVWSEDRGQRPFRLIASTLALQTAILLSVTFIPFIQTELFAISSFVRLIQDATLQGTSFVFGYLGGGPAPFEVSDANAMLILGIQTLPIILVTSALAAILWHVGLLRWIVNGLSWALERATRIGGATSLGAAGNVFMGMIEAPILIRPYLESLSRGELLIIMTTGLATVAGTVLAIYAAILEPVIPGALGHILTASLLSVPGAIAIAKIMIPDDGKTQIDGAKATLQYRSVIDAFAKGTQDGVIIMVNVGATLITILALVYIVDQGLGLIGSGLGFGLSLEIIFGWIFSPLAWAIGIPWAEVSEAGALIGTKAVLNEFIAYLNLAAADDGTLSLRSRTILLYAMCGFANLGSVSMMIAGLSVMAPARRDDIIALAPRSLIGGLMATCLSGALVGLTL